MSKYISIILGFALLSLVACNQNDLPISEEQQELEEKMELESHEMLIDLIDHPNKVYIQEGDYRLQADFIPEEPAVVK